MLMTPLFWWILIYLPDSPMAALIVKMMNYSVGV